MALTTLKPESNPQVLASCVVERNMMLPLLARLSKDGMPASLFWSNDGGASLPVKIRDASVQGLLLQTSATDPETLRLLEEGAVIFVAEYGRYIVQFKLPRLNRLANARTRSDGLRALGVFFDCPFPAQVWRINRREAFRASPGVAESKIDNTKAAFSL